MNPFTLKGEAITSLKGFVLVDLFIVLYATDDLPVSTFKDSPGFLSLCVLWHVILYLIVTGAALFVSDVLLENPLLFFGDPFCSFVPL